MLHVIRHIWCVIHIRIRIGCGSAPCVIPEIMNILSFIPHTVVRVLGCLDLDSTSLTWDIVHQGESVTLKLHWKLCKKKEFNNGGNELISEPKEPTSITPDVSKQHSAMGHDISPSTSLVEAAGDGGTRSTLCVKEESTTKNATAETCRFPGSPSNSSKDDDVESSHSTSCAQSRLKTNSPVPSSSSSVSPKNQDKALCRQNLFYTQKKLNIVKTEVVSDDELSDSLPDLDEVVFISDFPCSGSPSHHQTYNSDSAGNVRNEKQKRTVLDDNCQGYISNAESATSLRSASCEDKPCDGLKSVSCADNPQTKNLFSPAARDKLKSFTKDYSVSPASDVVFLSDDNSESRRSASSERHFLDIFPGSPAKRIKLAEKHDTDVKLEKRLGSDSLTSKNNEKDIVVETCGNKRSSTDTRQTSNADIKQTFQHRTHRQGYKCPRSPKHQEVFPHSLHQKNSKILYPSFLTDSALPDQSGVNTTELQGEFSAAQMNAVDASVEEGQCFMGHVVDLVQVFALNKTPPECMIKHIFHSGLLKSENMNQSLKSFNTLSYIQKCHPRAIKVNWDMICEIADTLGLDKPSLTSDKCSILNCTLALQLVLQVLRGELRTTDISDSSHIHRSQAYKVLSEKYFGNLKRVTDWITRVITGSEYKEVCEPYISLHIEPDVDPPVENENSKPCLADPSPATIEMKPLLPFLQQLIEVGILASTSNMDCARRLAEIFVHVLFYLPTIGHKKLLLQTMSSDLLRFKICQLFLEAQCDASQCYSEFPSSLQDVADSFFQAVPPKSQMTPPLSPMDDDLNEVDESLSFKGSPESCEQLCMIQYYGVSSYIRCIKSQCHKALRRRGSQDKVRYRVGETDRRMLRDEWQSEIEALRMKILELCGDLTPVTEQYLAMLLCLGDGR